MASYRIGRWAAKHARRRLPALVFAHVLHLFVRNFYGIDLYWTSRIGRRFLIGHQGAIVIHRYCTIGDDCTVRQGVTIGAADEWDPAGGPMLGDGVDIGAGAMVLGDIRIGSRVRIGPNAVVTTDVPDDSTVFAPPSRIVSWGAGAT
jgi:serine O-acetyltransferase